MLAKEEHVYLIQCYGTENVSNWCHRSLPKNFLIQKSGVKVDKKITVDGSLMHESNTQKLIMNMTRLHDSIHNLEISNGILSKCNFILWKEKGIR